MSFARYLIAFLIPPLHFLLQRRWLAFLMNGTVYALSFPFFLLFGIGILLWLLAALHAMWDLALIMREQQMMRQAELIAKKLNPETLAS